MNLRDIFVAGALSVIGLGGCSVFESKGCTDELRIHTIEMTRELTTSDAPDALSIEACLDDQCRSAKPAASGDISFDDRLGSVGATTGSVGAAADPAKRQVTVRYSVPEGSANATSELQLRVKKDATTLVDERATVRWSDDECHPSPNTTKL